MNITFNGVAPYVMNTLMLLVCFDALSWSCTLIRHAFWINRHPESDNGKLKLTFRMLLTASVLSGIHLLAINLAWVYYSVFYGYHIEMFLLISGVNVMVIHLYALLARCTGLGKEYWPHISSIVINYTPSICSMFVTRFK